MSRRRWLIVCHHLVLLVALASLLTLLVPVSRVTAEDPVVVFADPYLESAIRGQIWPPNYDGPIHQSEITPIRGIGVADRGIVSLSGLEHCINLEGAGFGGNQIGDLSPLSGLTKLKGLELKENQISDISPLSGLANLVSLVLNDNQISGISPLAGLTNLEQLWLGQNQIGDISSLSGLTKLNRLYLLANQISDISSLAGLTNLRELSLNTNQIGDIEPLVNNPGIDAGDWIDLRSNPLSSESINTWIPALLARGVGVAWDQNPPPPASTIAGYVGDGYGRRLGGVEVTLIAVSDDGSTTERAVTIADDNGHYSFGTSGDTIEDGKYLIEVALECHKTVGDTAIFSVHHDMGSPVRGQTDTFEFDGTSGQGVQNIEFVDPYVHPAATNVPANRLDDLAGMYYHTKQVIDFESNELGFTPDLSLPIEVHGYVSDDPSTSWDESQTCYYSDGQVYIGTGDSDYDDDDRPVTREWHEMFHELMDDTVGLPADHTGDENHDGYYNHCTGDSWCEGWANFWACALNRSLSDNDDDWYLLWGHTSLEFNWQVWDFDDEVSREEFASASLLVDLIDPVSPLDMDYIAITTTNLWSIIGSQPLANMYEVYIALTAANIGQSDTNANGQPDLDDLFIAHGFFADGGDPGNRVYDAGEEVGWGGKPDRKNTIRVPDAYLRIIVVDSKGNPISDGTLVVDVVFESPLDIYNYSYEVDLKSSDRLVYFEVAPDRCDPLMKMRVRDGEGNLSDEFVLSNSEYWDKVSEATTGYAAEHTFVIGAEGETTANTSGGVPVWVWPIVGVLAAAAGAGGFMLLRRRAKPG